MDYITYRYVRKILLYHCYSWEFY